MNRILKYTANNRFADKENLVVYSTINSNILIFSIIVFVCLILYVTFGAANSALGYNFQDFHLWQLLTAHFIHYDMKHLSLNMLALLIFLYLFPTKIKELVYGFLVAMLLIDTYLIFSNIEFYIGFSGFLYVIPGIAMGRLIFEKKYWSVIFISGIYITYSLSIYLTQIPGEQITWTPLVQSHFFGIVSGFVTKIMVTLYDKITITAIL
jgi:membrane associated rhomboid family serine protease